MLNELLQNRGRQFWLLNIVGWGGYIMAAYLGALREELGEEWEGRWIIHLDKRNGEFSVHVSPKSFEEDYEVFQSLRTAHQGIKGY